MVNRLGESCRVDIAMLCLVTLRGVVHRILNWLFSRVCLCRLKHLTGTSYLLRGTHKVVACG